MVCLGNICRSPLAEGILKHKVASVNLDVLVDSAGTSGWHEGEHPDQRAVQVARLNGVDISGLRARPFSTSDFDRFDHIFVMDAQNYRDVLLQATDDSQKRKVAMILNKSYPGEDMSVPDPYYGGDDGFKHVFNLLDDACEKIIESLR